MEIVYIETTIVSYLVAKPNRDPLIAGEQQLTREWWNYRRDLFQCITSDETLTEAARGDTIHAGKRLGVLAGFPRLPITMEIEELAANFLSIGAIPAKARSDAIHLAVASVAQADYLLTWNCRHLANAQILRRLEREAIRLDWQLPTVCTPLELMGDSTYEDEPNS